VLHGLLQRLEQQQPGLIAGLTECALQDRAAIDPEKSAAAAHGHQIAEEALRMLRLLSEQLNSAREQGSRKLSDTERTESVSYSSKSTTMSFNGSSRVRLSHPF
jgi:hypothetical protein